MFVVKWTETPLFVLVGQRSKRNQKSKNEKISRESVSELRPDGLKSASECESVCASSGLGSSRASTTLLLLLDAIQQTVYNHFYAQLL